MFAELRQRDVLLHHPYQSFAPVVQFIRCAVEDPNVIAIRQTIYRTGSKSVLMDLLLEAVRRGKEVTVVLELKARFDEETNINWADKLEQAGAHVVYGLVGLKTHAKMALVLRREGNAIRHYAHIGTGNYNPNTARFYTDFGLPRRIGKWYATWPRFSSPHQPVATAAPEAPVVGAAHHEEQPARRNRRRSARGESRQTCAHHGPRQRADR